MVGKRHASEEIAAKLAQANDLAAKGKSQREISKALGVSIMTYHRWRKTRGSASQHGHGRALQDSVASPDAARESKAQLELENSRLRRLVTDLLLEKLKLEEELRERSGTQLRRSR